MCGRFALSIPVGDLPHPLRERMDAEHQRRYAPRELICPGEPGGKKPFRKQSSSGANDNASENRRPPRRRRQNTRRDAA